MAPAPAPPLLRLRRATADDAAWLAEFGARTFRAAYSGLIEPAELERYVRAHYGEALQRAEIARPDSVVLLAIVGEHRCGFCWVHRPPPGAALPPCITDPTAANLSRIYVEPSRQGLGLGARLIEGAAAEARGMGAESLWLAVWQKNPRAIAFYRAHGYTEIGRWGFPTDPDPECDLIMARWLGAC